MWHEARKREKATQKLFNDHKKRAEKRREENRVDPSSFLQVNGVKAKLCLDPNVYKQAATSMVAWQGDPKVMIDRFDVRTTLESIPKDEKVRSRDSKQTARSTGVLDIDETKPMKTLLDYERYRLLMQNDLYGVGEESRLNLVAKSDIISDMKLKKLRGNRFGTSGETLSTDQVHNQRAQIRAPSKHMPAAGPTYNSVPPPSSLTSSQNSSSWRYDQRQSSSPDVPSVASKVIDLDDFDNYDPDLVDVREDCKQASDVAKKYGLSSEELILLSKLDNREASLKESLGELKRMQMHLLVNTASEQVYGPALPPNLAVKPENRDPVVSSESDDDSQVPQRSPSAMIPLRDEARVPSNNPSDNEAQERPVVRTPPPRADSPHNRTESLKSQPVEQPIEHPQPENGRRQESSPPPAGNRRRASTPLAYKRNRRSSRSLSRERRREELAARHRRRRNSSSSSSSASSSEQKQQHESNSSRRSHHHHHPENRSRKRLRDR